MASIPTKYSGLSTEALGFFQLRVSRFGRLGSAIPTDLEQLVMACLAKNLVDRPQSAVELQKALRALEDFGSWDGAWWWEEFGEAVTLRRTDSNLGTNSERTFGVDLEARL